MHLFASCMVRMTVSCGGGDGGGEGTSAADDGDVDDAISCQEEEPSVLWRQQRQLLTRSSKEMGYRLKHLIAAIE